MTWTCPDCGRSFGRAKQGHTCSPALSLDEYLATSPPHERPVAEVFLEHVATLPEARIEPVQVGLFVKRRSTFAQLRTMTRWVALGLTLPRIVRSPDPSRKVTSQGNRHWHVYNLHTSKDYDQPLRDLVVEAYEADLP